MKVLFRQPLQGLSWDQLREVLSQHFSKVDYRSVPLEPGVVARWSAHPVGSRDYFTFTWRGPSIELEGQGLDRLQPVIETLGLQQEPPEQVATVADEQLRFVAAAAWESEGCVLQVSEPGLPIKSFAIDRALLDAPALSGVRGCLAAVLPEVEDSAPAQSEMELEPGVLLAQVRRVEVERADNFFNRELRACVSELHAWLARRKAAKERITASYYEE